MKRFLGASLLLSVFTGCWAPVSEEKACRATRVTVTPDNSAIDVGGTVSLTAAVELRVYGDYPECVPSNAIVGWQSLDPLIATVGNQGRQTAEIIGVGVGDARIEATAGDFSPGNGLANKKDTVIVHITPVTASSIQLSTMQVSLVAGNSTRVTATVKNPRGEDITSKSTLTWAVTNNPDIATVSQDGTITGVAKGPATVTVTATATAGTATAIVIVTVSDPPNVSVSSIEIDGPKTVQAAKSIELNAIVKGSDGTTLVNRPVTWTSSAETKAKVAPKPSSSQTGVVTGDKVGVVTIRAASEGKETAVDVTVIPGDPNRVVATPDAASLRVGEEAVLSAEAFDIRDNKIISPTFGWTSLSSAIATVDGTGKVTAVAVGTAKIEAKLGGVADTTAITVVPATAPRRFAFALANKSQLASYVPDEQSNSAGTPVSVTRQGPGAYRVRFTGLATGFGETETVLVTRHGEGNHYCKLVSWANAGSDLEAQVACYAAAGVVSDAEFSITLLGNDVLGGRFAFALADQPSVAGPYTPANSYNSSPQNPQPPIRITRSALGYYLVTFGGNAAGAGVHEALHVTAVGPGNVRCNLASILVGETVAVRCATPDGLGADSRFAITLTDQGRGGGRIAGSAYASRSDEEEFEDPGTFNLPSTHAYNSNNGAVDIVKLPTFGRYEIIFRGLAPLAGTPLTVQVVNKEEDEAKYCGVVRWALVGLDIKVTVSCWHEDGEGEDEEFMVIVLQ